MPAGAFSLVTRSLLTTTLFAILGALAMAAVSSAMLARFWAVTAADDPPERVLQTLRQCHRWETPAGPLILGTRHYSLYDPATLEPKHAGAQAVPDTVARRLRAGEPRVIRTGWPVGAGTQVHAVLRPDSPCGLLAVTIPSPPLLRPQVMGMVVWMLLATGAIALGGAYFFTARPLLRRVREAAQSAENVGTPSFRVPRGGDWASMGLIHRSLARANDRIRHDAALLDARADAIEALLAGMAHDLRTPLAIIQLSVQRALKDGDASGLSRVLGEVQHATAMLENIGTDAQLQSATLSATASPFDLARTVEEAQARFRVLGEHTGVVVEAAWPDRAVPVMADPVLCGRVLANLVHNSIRHGSRNVAIDLSRDGGTFTLSISDDGPGLPGPVLAWLSQPATDGQGAGQAGRGLKIVRALCERLGFELRAATAGPEGGGTCITLRGPVLSEPE